MWRIPAPLIAGQQNTFIETFTADELIGNLYTYLGSPTGAVSVIWTIDGCDLGEINIPNNFGVGSTFSFTCINNGRILGVGGNGGRGGDDFGSTGEAGLPGVAGGYAIRSDGWAVDVNIDDGFLFGGGGGGGGGAYEDTGTGGDAGGGGGGGQGYNGGAGGAAGVNIGLAPASNGAAGTRSSNGSGGLQGGLSNPQSGGAGGKFGSGGGAGKTSDIISSFGIGPYRGGIGGRAGYAFQPLSGGSINYNGAKSEATLRSEGRIKGLAASIVPASITNISVNISVAGLNSAGVVFRSDGTLDKGNLSGSPTNITTQWLTALSITEAAKYEIRERNNDLPFTDSEDVGGVWDTRVNATPGNWSALTSSRTQAFARNNFQTSGTLIEIRRNDVPGSPDDEIISTFFVTVTDENGV